jgi:hypothetical protein
MPLVDALSFNSVIHTLVLQNLSLSAPFFQALGPALAINPQPSLTHIGKAYHSYVISHSDVRNNKMTDDGAIALAKGLKNLPALTHLDVCYNRITAPGISAICQSIQPALLKVLALQGNPLGTGGGLESLVGLLAGATNLLALDIGHCQTDISIVVPMLKQKLDFVNLGFNTATDIKRLSKYISIV